MIEIETTDGVAQVRLAHGKANAFDVALLEALSAGLADLAADAAVDAVVLTGNGRLFSAGVDLFQVLEGGNAYLERFLPVLSSALGQLFVFPKPVVAALEGHAIAGGLIVALAADRVLMAEGKGQFGLTELRVGVPLPSVPLAIARHRLGSVATARLIFDARTLGVEEAASQGLADTVVAPERLLPEADAAARALAALPAGAFALSKRQLRAGTLEQAHAADDQAVFDQWCSDDARGRIQQFLDQTVGRKGASRS